MTSYLHDMDGTYTKMIKEDEGTRLSKVLLARMLLRRSGLNHDEKLHTLASCGHEYNLDKIRTALRLTYADANRDDARRRFSQTPKASPTTHKKPPFRRVKKHGINHLDALSEEDPHQEEHDQEEDDHEADNDEEDDDDQLVEGEQPEVKTKKVPTSTRMTNSSGRSSTKDSRPGRSSRARQKVGKNPLVVDEVDIDLPLQVHRKSRRSRRRRP